MDLMGRRREYGGGQRIWCDAILCFSFSNEKKLIGFADLVSIVDISS
jgi:hypothetical protein